MICYLCGSENANIEVKTPRKDVTYLCESCDNKLNYNEGEKEDG